MSGIDTLPHYNDSSEALDFSSAHGRRTIAPSPVLPRLNLGWTQGNGGRLLLYDKDEHARTGRVFLRQAYQMKTEIMLSNIEPFKKPNAWRWFRYLLQQQLKLLDESKKLAAEMKKRQLVDNNVTIKEGG